MTWHRSISRNHLLTPTMTKIFSVWFSRWRMAYLEFFFLIPILILLHAAKAVTWSGSGHSPMAWMCLGFLSHRFFPRSTLPLSVWEMDHTPHRNDIFTLFKGLIQCHWCILHDVVLVVHGTLYNLQSCNASFLPIPKSWRLPFHFLPLHSDLSR